MTISRSLMERQLRAGGGIMTLEEPRQGYFLGKLVKKAKRVVKKVVKSPIGKAALLGAGAMYAGGLGPFAANSSMFGGRLAGMAGSGFLRGTGSGILSGLQSKKGFLGTIGNAFRVGGDKNEGFSGLRLLGGGLGAAALAAPFLMGGDEEEVEEETPFSQTPDSIASIVNMAKNQDPSLRFLPKPKFVDNFYAANGGLATLRPGYRIGGSALGLTGLAAKGGQKVGEMVKAGIGKVKSLFDDADISVQIRDDDVMTDAGLQAQAVGQDIFITPKSNKAVQVIDGLIEEGYDIAKAEDGSYAISAVDEGALDLITQRLRIGSKGADEFIDGQDYMGGPLDEESKMIYDALRNRKAEGGIMDLNGMEKDYREGGFVPLGAEERADDVPARLSKNEFVFTADAVRSAGGGDIDQGAEVMQNMMDNLEEGGTISEESQGMNPAQEMFDQSQMLENRIA